MFWFSIPVSYLELKREHGDLWFPFKLRRGLYSPQNNKKNKQTENQQLFFKIPQNIQSQGPWVLSKFERQTGEYRGSQKPGGALGEKM